MTKCIQRIRDLFEYALYKFTLYLLTYLLLSYFGRDVMEEHCSAYGLPTRGVVAIVATAISQVKSRLEHRVT